MGRITEDDRASSGQPLRLSPAKTLILMNKQNPVRIYGPPIQAILAVHFELNEYVAFAQSYALKVRSSRTCLALKATFDSCALPIMPPSTTLGRGRKIACEMCRARKRRCDVRTHPLNRKDSPC